MPQLDQLLEVYSSQFFWLLIVIGITYFVIGKGMVPKISQTVEMREKRIADDLKAAEQAREQADATEDAYRKRMNDARDEANEVLHEARADIAKKNEKRIAKVDAELGKKAEAASQELGEAKRSALAEVESVAVEAAREIVSTLSGADVSAAEAKKAVKSAFGGKA